MTSGKRPVCGFENCYRTAYTMNNPLCYTHYMQDRNGRPLTPIRQRNAVINGRKVCPRCLIQKPVEDYYRRRGGQLTAYCKVCHGKVSRGEL
jgi:hypothetical protein